MTFKLIATQTLLSIATIAIFATAASAAGDSSCQIVYGGGEICPPDVKITIDKKVQKPTKGGEFVDNLSSTDEKFQPGQEITFRLTVQNTGSKDITVNVVDVLPTHLTYVSGGTYDASNKQVANDVELKVGESKTLTIVAKVNEASTLPNESTTCVTNVARATHESGVTAEDNAQLCVEKPAGKKTPPVQGKVPMKEIPATGPELFSLIALGPTGLAGFYLRRKANS